MTAKLQRPQRSRKLTSEQIDRLEEGLRELGINPGDMDPDDLLRQLEARVEFVVDPPDDAEAVLPAAKERKRRQNRESEDNRKQDEKVTGKVRRVRGFKRAPGGFLVEEIPPERNVKPHVKASPEDLAMAEELKRLAMTVLEPFDCDADDPPKFQKLRGLVPLGSIERVRAAHAAAYDLPPSRNWEDSFRSVVKYALRYRLAGGKPSLSTLEPLLKAQGILAFLRRHFGDSVPATLTAAHVRSLLQSSTLARGGRGRKNADQAVDQLLEELKQTREG